MASPWVNLLSNMPGGGLNAAMKANNALANENVLRQINQIKKQYMPSTLQAEAASKLAYANLMGPQFLAKLLQNPGAIANMGDPAARSALQKAVQAGMGQGTGQNYLNNIPQHTGIGQPSTNSFSGRIKDAFHALLGQNSQQQPNAFAPSTNMSGQYNAPTESRSSIATNQMQDIDNGRGHQEYNPDQDAPINHEIDTAFTEWLKSPEGVREVAKGEQANMPSEQQILDWKRQKDGLLSKSYAENTGSYTGAVKQGEEEGKYRAQALKDIGQSQLALSNSGVSLHRMASLLTNPVMQNMRSRIPFFQDKQLSYLEKMGTKEEQEMIGDLITTSEQIIASGVQAFGGKPLVREFDLLQRQKVNRNDTIPVAQGKIKASIAIHDIAEKKNDIIAGLLQQGVNEADAIKQANKMVDISKIERDTDNLLADKITDDDINATAKANGMTREQVIKRLKDEGRYNG